MYFLNPSDYFLKKAKKLVRKNLDFVKKLRKTLTKLETNPFDRSLKTHLVIRKNGKEGFSSFISNDLRIVWEYKNQNQKQRIIDIVDIGGHSGKNKVYR